MSACLSSARRLRIALGTWVAVEASSASSEQTDAAIEAAFAAIAEVEHRMHPTRTGSDLARINAAAVSSAQSGLRADRCREIVTVHRCTWRLLELAKRLYEMSGGVFEPCLPERSGHLNDIELLPQWKVCSHAPVSLDFGGFAKGYAVDCAVKALMRHGCGSGLVNAGGDLRVFGSRKQIVFVREPNGTLRPLELASAAVAVSALNGPHRPAEHRGYYRRTAGAPQITCPRAPVTSPLIVPSDRRTSPLQAVVIAAEAVIADALTKCVLLAEPSVTARALRELGARDYSLK